MKSKRFLVLFLTLFAAHGCANSSTSDVESSDPAPVSTLSVSESDIQTNLSTANARMSLETFGQIKNGMSYDEVAAIMGSAGLLTRASTVGNMELKSFKWKGENYQRVYVNFRANKVYSKSQSGLADGEK